MYGRTSLFSPRQDFEYRYGATLVTEGVYQSQYNITIGLTLETITVWQWPCRKPPDRTGDR